MANRRGKVETMTDFLFLGSRISVDDDCSHEIKRHWKESYADLVSVLKSRDITLPTTISIFRAMVFAVALYKCESWTLKKAEHRRIGAFELWCWRRLLRVPWTAGRSDQSILMEISPEYSLEGLMLKLKLQCFGDLMRRANSLEKTLLLGKLKAKGEGESRR